MKNKTSFWGSVKAALTYYLKTLKDKLPSILQKKITRTILKKLAISGGIKGWLIGFVVGELIEKGDEYLIEPAFRKIGYYIEVIDGTKVYKRIENAQDRDDWRDAVRDA